jgi:hypothetical protein
LTSGKRKVTIKKLNLRKSVLLFPLQKMREEMDWAWKDFFAKNPCRKKQTFCDRLRRLRRISTDLRCD